MGLCSLLASVIAKLRYDTASEEEMNYFPCVRGVLATIAFVTYFFSSLANDALCMLGVESYDQCPFAILIFLSFL